MGLAGRLPVYIDGEFGARIRHAQLSGGAFRMSSMQNLDAQGFGCELWRINPDTGGHQSILSVGTAVNVPTYETSFPIFNAEWYVTVFPSRPWYAHASLWLFITDRLVLSFAGAMGQASLRTIRRMEKQMAEGRIRELQSQLEYGRMNVLLTQIRSHFFYHTLNAIQALIRLDPDAAYKMTEDFSRFLRFKVDSVGLRGGLVPFKDEIRSVQAYADINAVQLGERLHMEYDIFNANFMIPVLTIQPVVENAIDHGIKPKVGGGTVRVSLLRNDGFYEVTVEDDGVGFSPGEEDGKPSVGLANIRARLAKHPGCSITVESTPGKGTRVVLRFPGNLGKERPQ
jgi:sensor histidine kinase YesM